MKIIAAALIAGLAAQDEAPDAARKVRDQIASIRITIDFANAKLENVIAYLQEFSGLNFHLDADARAKEGDDSKVTLKLKDVTLKTALKFLLSPRDLRCVYRDGVLLIATKAKLGSQTVTRVYEVRDILFRIQDFPGPTLGLKDKEPGIIFEPLEEPKTTFNEEDLSGLIKTSTGDRSWEDSSSVSIQQIDGLLVISQTRSIHEEVRRLLDRLRQFK